MNITPNLPSLSPLPSDPDRKVGSLRPANRTRDTLDGAEARRAASQKVPAPVEQTVLATRPEAAARPVVPGLPARASRALAAYTDVAEGPERSRLRSLLGFDDYA